MCFSATVSFGAGTVLTALGTISLSKARVPQEYPFAAIPLLFGIQQITEGFLWLAMIKPEYSYLQTDTTWLFLLFAQPIWPLWMPWSMWLLEQDPGRKRWLGRILGAGLVLAIYLLACLFIFDTTAAVMEHHIRYYLYFPKALMWITFPLYLLTTLTPTFVSSVEKMRLFAVFNLISFVLSGLFYREYLVSVWCFFAAVLSVIVVIIMSHRAKSRQQQNVLLTRYDDEPLKVA